MENKYVEGNKIRAVLIKKRAYELLRDGHLSRDYINILMSEFNISERSCYSHTKDLKNELKLHDLELIEEIRPNIIRNLYNDILTVKDKWQKYKAIEVLMKLTGMGSETLNVNTETIVFRTNIIEEYKENKDE